jgi:RimJ/RimL family protein N-acetyltransferase
MEGEKVNLRQITPNDCLKLKEWSEDEELKGFMGETLPFRPEVELEEYGELRRGWNSYAFAIDTKSGELIGDIYLVHITWRNRNAELVVRVGEKTYWDKGYGTDAISVLLDMAFCKMKLKRVYLRVYVSNRRAIRCYEKCGFVKEGILHLTGKEYGKRRIFLMSLEREKYFTQRQNLEDGKRLIG